MEHCVEAAAKRSLLFVEDDPVAGTVIGGALERKYPGLTIHLAGNGRVGLELFRALNPEIVLTDIQMPEINGIGMAQEIRQIDADAQIIVMTAPGDADLLQDCIRLGVSRYLPKPVSYQLLFEAVDDCLSRIGLRRTVMAQHDVLIERGQRLRLALESANLGTLDFQLDSGKVFWDERCRCMFGVQGGDSTDYRIIMQCMHPEDRRPFNGAVRVAVAGDGAFQRKFRVVWADGSIRWLALTGRIYFEGEASTRRAARFIGVSKDITSLILVTEELRESETRYRRLFSSLQEGFSLHKIILSDAGMDYWFLDGNEAFEKLTGMNRERLIGKTIKEIFPDLQPHLFEALDEVAITGEPALLEYVSRLSARHFEVHVYSPVKGQIALLYSESTERRKLQEEREKNDRLHSLGVLAGGIAHDFNNILTVSIGNISLALSVLADDHPVAAMLQQSEKALLKATSLTKQLLTFARGGEPIKKIVNAERLIVEAAQLILRGSNCRPMLSIAPDLWHLNVDPGQIQQVLNNLIINAVQSMPDGGTVSIHAANRAVGTPGVAPGSYVEISVTDQGCGIPAENLSKIFDPYFTTKPTGTGLGLASVYSIINRHGGSISVTSPPGAGTTFDMLLCAVEGGRLPDGDDVQQLRAADRSIRILLMDDDEMIRSMAEQMLASLGYATTTCTCGEEAEMLYRAGFERGERFEAVILDMTIPGGMGGKEAAARIREFDGEALLILSSGYSNDLSSDRKSADCCQGILAKPYNIRQLGQELSRILVRQ